ncbi:hypothetical protein F3Y22_tig00110204pilonHSYRG00133 [Hibiscus syriacus]|uniref:Uncharacterized protein n=1 Tax=Hibiscus syriacus TaxID=106335 RepID=A0A6A3BA25_HIBSY|nr:hypothetical protein F3Y22_tig00110204pilonHSYRG00133 [Hibiscus syriacus]
MKQRKLCCNNAANKGAWSSGSRRACSGEQGARQGRGACMATYHLAWCAWRPTRSRGGHDDLWVGLCMSHAHVNSTLIHSLGSCHAVGRSEGMATYGQHWKKLMEMGDQYGLPDLRRLLTRRTHLPASLPLPSEPYLAHGNMTPVAPYNDADYMLSNGIAMPSGLLRFSTSSTTAFTASASSGGGWSMGSFDGGNSRWPSKKPLLFLRSDLDLIPSSKRLTRKDPCGTKYLEKFENLHKYYKKTKERKAGDGKNYRFFKQLEAICGETSNPQSSVPETNINVLSNPQQETREESMQERKISESLGLFEFDDSSSGNIEDEDDDELSAFAFMENQKRVKKGWKTKNVKEFVDSQMKKLIDSQDVWIERMLKVVEDKEQGRESKEQEWRRREAARFDKEHELRVKERAWIEVRDSAEVAAMRKLKIEAKMVSLGYEREANNAECYKKHKEDYFQQLDSTDGEENKSVYSAKQMDSSSSPSSSYGVNSFHFSAVNQGDQWYRYGLKMMSKGKNQQS